MTMIRRVIFGALMCAVVSGGVGMPIQVDAQAPGGASTPGDCTQKGTGLVPCGCDTHTVDDDGNVSDGPDTVVSEIEQCGFDDLIQLIQNILTWLIIISIPVSALLFAYAGFLYVTAAGDEGKVRKAHSVFKNVAIGFGIILAAWIIVYTLAGALLEDKFLRFLES